MGVHPGLKVREGAGKQVRVEHRDCTRPRLHCPGGEGLGSGRASRRVTLALGVCGALSGTFRCVVGVLKPGGVLAHGGQETAGCLNEPGWISGKDSRILGDRPAAMVQETGHGGWLRDQEGHEKRISGYERTQPRGRERRQ